jgi:hypothetical protein
VSGDGITGNAPDYPETRLAFRVWRLHRPTRTLLSLNAPQGKTPPWIAAALADPSGGWPQDGPGGYPRPLAASCDRRHKDNGKHGDGCRLCEAKHGPVPAAGCTCGIYAATDLDVINSYLSADAPVLGVVELGGRVIPAQQGYRAAYARIAAILLIDQRLTLPRQALDGIAAEYQVPALVPHSVRPEEYRDRLRGGRSLADEAEDYLRGLGEQK